jgi:hypothetical protein
MGRSEAGAEILVHITAPSAAADDVKYRALTQAYLDFEPKGHRDLAQDPTAKPSAAPTDKLISPQASFSSVWDNVGSPSLTGRNQRGAPPAGKRPPVPVPPAASCQLQDDSQISWAAPPSEIPDSMPDNDIRAPAFNTPTRVLSYFLQSTEPPSVSSCGLTGVEAPEGGRDAARSNLSQSTHLDGLPGRESAPDSSPSTSRPYSHPRQDQSPVKAVPGSADVAEGCGANKAPVLPCSDPAAGPETHQTTRPDSLREKESAFLLAGSSDWAHETQLISNEPDVANHRLGPRAPQDLEKLATSMQMERKYKPKYQARDLRPFERGYWLMGLDGWDLEEKVKAWGFLGNYICRDGKAGWGTRACRDESWAWIRLYGWEHIAAELYILLYVASYRKLKCMEAKFYGAAGDVLIVVGSRGTQLKSC